MIYKLVDKNIITDDNSKLINNYNYGDVVKIYTNDILKKLYCLDYFDYISTNHDVKQFLNNYSNVSLYILRECLKSLLNIVNFSEHYIEIKNVNVNDLNLFINKLNNLTIVESKININIENLINNNIKIVSKNIENPLFIKCINENFKLLPQINPVLSTYETTKNSNIIIYFLIKCMKFIPNHINDYSIKKGFHIIFDNLNLDSHNLNSYFKTNFNDNSLSYEQLIKTEDMLKYLHIL